MAEVINEKEEVREKILEIFGSNDAVTLATTGGEFSPWILGAYFASRGLDMYLLLETHGKTMANLRISRNAAVAVSKNNAMEDFLQGTGTVEILDDSKEPEVRKMILEKMPWFQTFTPVTPVKISIRKFFVSSLQNQWFPAKVFETE